MAAGKTYDAGSAIPTQIGVSGARFTSTDQSSAAAAVTDDPGTAAIVVDDIIITSNDAVDLVFTEETAGTVRLPDMYMAADGFRQVTPRGKLKLGDGNRLMVQAAAAGEFDVLVLYHYE